MPHCFAKTEKGLPCRGYAVQGSSFCFWHEPSLLDARTKARRLGGLRHRAANVPSQTSDPDLKTPVGLVRFVEELIHDTCGLDPSVNRARALGYLTRVQHKTIELSQLDQRVQALELILRKREVPDAKD